MRSAVPLLSDDIGDVSWRPIEEVCQWVGASGARLLIIELALPPVGLEPDAIPPRAFLQGLAGQVEAVIFTRFPLHPRLLSAFNNALYKQIGAGRTIESAVQLARNETYINRFFGDVAQFGWFTLVTGNRAGMRVLREPTETAAGVGGAGPLREPVPPSGDDEAGPRASHPGRVRGDPMMNSTTEMLQQAAARLAREYEVDAGLDAVAQQMTAAAPAMASVETANKLLRDRARALKNAVAEIEDLRIQITQMVEALPFTEQGWQQRAAEREAELSTDFDAGLAAWLSDWSKAAARGQFDGARPTGRAG